MNFDIKTYLNSILRCLILLVLSLTVNLGLAELKTSSRIWNWILVKCGSFNCFGLYLNKNHGFRTIVKKKKN